jgi:VIT1/CCC1 family predicted Fe2+/Mn2+ transporter
MKLEREHLLYHRDKELDEIREMFGDMGLPPAQVEDVVTALDADDESLIKAMMALEFGIVEEERRSPYRAAIYSGLLFIAGSLPTVLPFVFVESTGRGLLFAGIGAGFALFAVGAAKTVTTRKNPIWSGLENVAIATVGAGLAYAVGSAYNAFA